MYTETLKYSTMGRQLVLAEYVRFEMNVLMKDLALRHLTTKSKMLGYRSQRRYYKVFSKLIGLQGSDDATDGSVAVMNSMKARRIILTQGETRLCIWYGQIAESYPRIPNPYCFIPPMPVSYP